MKKLKFGLILAFSMTLALGLTACSNADEYTIERIRYSGDASITLTDAETSEEESALEAFNEKVAETRLRVYADGSLMRNIISGADCEYDTSSVVWGEVGSYSVTVTPKENNANALTTTLTVTIEHQFGDPDPATGVARCTHCGKVESNTTFATPVTVNYGAFLGGYTSDSTQDPEKALLYMRDTYFIKDNEKETPAKTEAVRVNRLLERRKSIVQVYQDAIELRHDIRNVDEDLEDQAYATTIYDTTGGAVGGDAEVRIRRMEALRRYARLLVADLKMKTANEVSLLTFTKLKKPQKTITEFNLDDYIFEMPEKSSEGSK